MVEDWSHVTTKLKPCPFCGTEPWGIFGTPDEGIWVECGGDDCPDLIYRWADTREEVAVWYNALPRPPLPQQSSCEEKP